MWMPLSVDWPNVAWAPVIEPNSPITISFELALHRQPAIARPTDIATRIKSAYPELLIERRWDAKGNHAMAFSWVRIMAAGMAPVYPTASQQCRHLAPRDVIPLAEREDYSNGSS